MESPGVGHSGWGGGRRKARGKATFPGWVWRNAEGLELGRQHQVGPFSTPSVPVLWLQGTPMPPASHGLRAFSGACLPPPNPPSPLISGSAILQPFPREPPSWLASVNR